MSGLSAGKRTALSFAALILPVLAGLAWMIIAGASLRLVITNSAALIVALVVAAFPARVLYSPWVAIACASAVVMTAIGGIEIDGVKRWFALGPLHLHTAMLVLPLFVATLPLLPVVQRTVALASVLIATVIQPDLAMTLALLGVILVAPADGQKRIGLLTGGLTLLAAFMFDGPQPAPVAFIEGVLTHAWAASKVWFAVLVAGQFSLLAIAFSAQTQGRALAGFWAGCALASVIGPYPAPMIGGGAAPVIGFGLALGALRRSQRNTAQGVGKGADLA